MIIFDTLKYDEAAVKHALRTKAITIGRHDDTIRIVIPSANDKSYLMIKRSLGKGKKLPEKCTDMSLRSFPKDDNGNPLVVMADPTDRLTNNDIQVIKSLIN